MLGLFSWRHEGQQEWLNSLENHWVDLIFKNPAFDFNFNQTLVNNVFEIGVTCSTGKNDAAGVVEVVAAAVVAVAAGGA